MSAIPILKLGPVLFLTVPEHLNDAQAKSLEDVLLRRIVASRAEAVVLDLTALELIDSFMARVLTESAKAIHLMGADLVVVGMRPAATITLLELGLDLGSISTALDLESGLAKLGYRLERREQSHPPQMGVVL